MSAIATSPFAPALPSLARIGQRLVESLAGSGRLLAALLPLAGESPASDAAVGLELTQLGRALR